MSDGSLRVIRNGIGINEQATIELPGIKVSRPVNHLCSRQAIKQPCLSSAPPSALIALHGVCVLLR
jgi:hypothetical protein